MQNFVFIYILNKKYKCLVAYEAQIMKSELKEEGWEHTATLNPETWMEFFLNGDEARRSEAIECISKSL